MSNIGQAALIVVGTVVGAYFGNPELGFALGGIAGSVLFPTQLPRGPQLTDNRTTTATIGEPVPIVFGTAAVSGTVIWLAPYVQSSTEVGGKGGPEQQTYNYNQSIAIGLCESPLDLQQAIHGLTRVWENGTIVYDIRPQQPADTVTGQIAETDDEYANRLAASATYAETFTLYLGTEDQTADPTIEAVEGFGAAPAFRGLAYIVYPNRLLQTAQGWRHPNFTFEVYQVGTGQCVDTTEYSNGVLYPWNPISDLDPRNVNNSYSYQFISNNGAANGPIRSDLSAAIDDGGLKATQYGWSTGEGAGGAYAPWFPITVGEEQTVYLFYNSIDPSSHTYTALSGDPGDANEELCGWGEANPNGYFVGAYYSGASLNFLPHGVWSLVPEGTGNIGSCLALGLDQNCHSDDSIEVTRAPGPPADPCEGLPASPVSGYCIRSDGKYIRGGEWTLDTTQTYKVLAQFTIIGPDDSGRGGTVSQYPLNPCLPPGSGDDNQTFWTAAYNEAVANGQLPSGWTYGDQYPIQQDSAYTIDQEVCVGAGSQVSVGSVIAALCERAGLTTIDVTDMNSVYIDGYSISSVSTGKDCIDPLRSVGFFDAVESGTTLRFQSRGKPIVATLTTDDFGCYDDKGGDDGSSASQVPPSITVVRADQTTLPRSIRLHYKSVSRDYMDAQQASPYRLITKSVNDQDITIPICVGDTQALQAAEVLWADAWAGETSYTIAVDQSQWPLEPGDAIGVPVDNVIQRMRIISDSNASGVLRTLQLVSDDSGAYISYAVAEANQVQPQTLTLLSGTDAELLDLPALQDADSDAGFYVAAQRDGTGNAWKGCVVYKSIDGGVTYQTQFSLVIEATIGTLAEAVSPSEYFTWDDETEILVNVTSSAFTFESRTDDAVLSGANAAAIGSGGRWEIVQFANAEQISSTQWKLTRLLRGRRGTEHNIAKSQSGDSLVILSTGDLSRIVLQSTEIGALRDYRATSIGASFSSGNVYPFTGHAMALVPFSPVDAVGTWQSDENILISWIRRDRLGGTLMSGVDMPLSEATLAFQVDILQHDSPASPETVLRTIATSSINCVYTAAMQTADFGAPVDSFKANIYQMSAEVGRGTPLSAILTKFET